LVLFLHGTGGSTHSWAACTEALTSSCTVVSIDLPGHGFTQRDVGAPDGPALFSLHRMAQAVGDLLDRLGARPVLVVGHSAGVPILLQLVLDGRIAPSRVLGVNPALVPPPALYLALLAPLLGAIVEREVIAQGGAWLAQATRIVEVMLASSGTRLSPDALARYRWLCTQPEHVHAALTMMSRWDLPALLRDTLALRTPLEVLAGSRDRWVPAGALRRVVDRIPHATWREIEAGHLIPDERPDDVVQAVRRALAETA